MKRFYNYTFQMVCIYILFLTVFSVFNIEISKVNYIEKVHNINEEKAIDSSLLVKNEEETTNEEENTKEEKSIINDSVKEEKKKVTETKKQEEAKQEVKEETKQEIKTEVKEETPVVEEKKEEPKPALPAVNIIDTSSYQALSSETVTISHYGHDCSGCKSGLVASGYYIGDGRLYYNDKTFGSVRIVAADNKYPLGTIIRLSYNGKSFAAIVLDRGGGIGDGRKYQIDLLASSEKEAYQLGVVYNATLEVLRLGY